MILFLQAIAKEGLEAAEELKTSKEVVNDSKVFQDIVHLIDVIIWPIALIIGLYMFKGQIAKVINSIGSIKASTTGFEMNFMESKLDEATKLIGLGSTGIISKSNESIISKDGASIIPKSSENIIPKSSENIIPKRSHAESPYQMLIELQDAINAKLTYKAKQKGITVAGSSNFALTNDLADRDIIDTHTTTKLKTLIELNTIGLNSTKITHDQVIKMNKLFNNITL